MQGDIHQEFEAYLEETSARARNTSGLYFLKRLLTYSEDNELPVDIVIHVTDLWLDFFSVEVRMEQKDEEEDNSSSSSRSCEGPPSEIKEIMTAREWLLSEDGSSTADKTSRHTLLIHHVYIPVTESSPNSPSSRTNGGGTRDSAANSNSQNDSYMSRDRGSMSGFDPHARAALDSFHIAGSAASSTNDYALLQAAVGGDLKAMARGESGDGAKGRGRTDKGWTREMRSIELDLEENRCHFLWITHCLSHLCGLSVHREAIYQCYGGLFADFVSMAMFCVTQMHEEDVVRWADLLELPKVPGASAVDGNGNGSEAVNQTILDTSEYSEPSLSFDDVSCLGCLDDLSLHAGEATLLHAFDKLSKQSAFHFSAFWGLLSLSVRCCGSVDGHNVYTFDNTAASMDPGLSYPRQHDQINPSKAMMRMGCGALPAQPWHPLLSEELFGMTFLPCSNDTDGTGNENEEVKARGGSGRGREKGGVSDPLRTPRSPGKGINPSSPHSTPSGSYLSFLDEFASAGLVYGIFNMLRKLSPLAKLLLTGRETIISLRESASASLIRLNSTGTVPLSPSQSRFGAAIALDSVNESAPAKELTWSTCALDAIEDSLNNTYASILLLQSESLVAVRKLTELDGDTACQQIQSCGGAYVVAALSVLPASLGATSACNKSSSSVPSEYTKSVRDEEGARCLVREDLLLISRVHNSLVLIAAMTRAAHQEKTPSMLPSRSLDSAANSSGNTSRSVAEAHTVNSSQPLSRELTELTLGFLEALPSYLVWLQGAPAVCHAEAEAEMDVDGASDDDKSDSSAPSAPALSSQAGLLVASETTSGSVDLPSRTWPWCQDHSAGASGFEQSRPGGKMVRDAPAMASHRVYTGSEESTDGTLSDTASIFVTTTALGCARTRPPGTFLNSSNRPAGYVGGLGLGCRAAAWAAHNPALNGMKEETLSQNNVAASSSTRGLCETPGAGQRQSFDSVWGFPGKEDMLWVWGGIRGKAVTRLLFLLFDHCFNSPFACALTDGSHTGSSSSDEACLPDTQTSQGRKQVLRALFTVLSAAAGGLSSLKSDSTGAKSAESLPKTSAVEVELPSAVSSVVSSDRAALARYQKALPVVHTHIVLFLFRCLTEKPTDSAPFLQLGLDSGEAAGHHYSNTGGGGGLPFPSTSKAPYGAGIDSRRGLFHALLRTNLLSAPLSRSLQTLYPERHGEISQGYHQREEVRGASQPRSGPAAGQDGVNNNETTGSSSRSGRILVQSWSASLRSPHDGEGKHEEAANTTNDAALMMPMLAFTHALLRDLTMELAVMVIESLASKASDTESSASRAVFGNAILCLVDLVSPATPDLVVVPVIRLLHTVIRRYHDHRLGLATLHSGSRHSALGASAGVRGAGIWGILSGKCVSIVKSQILSLRSSGNSTNTGNSSSGVVVVENPERKSKGGDSRRRPSGHAQPARPFLWPARVAAMEAMQLLVRFPQCGDWVWPFFDYSAEAPSQRHCVLICLALDPRLRIAAYDVLYCLLHHCAEQVFLATVTLAKNVPVLASSSNRSSTVVRPQENSSKHRRGKDSMSSPGGRDSESGKRQKASEAASSDTSESTTASTDTSSNPAVCTSLAHLIIKALLGLVSIRHRDRTRRPISEVACYLDVVAGRSGSSTGDSSIGSEATNSKEGKAKYEGNVKSSLGSKDQEEVNRLMQCYYQWQPLLTALYADFEVQSLTGNNDERDGRGAALGALHTLLLFAEDPHYAGVHQFLLKRYSAGGSLDATSPTPSSHTERGIRGNAGLHTIREADLALFGAYSDPSLSHGTQRRSAKGGSSNTGEEASSSLPASCDSGSIMHELVWALSSGSSIPNAGGGTPEKRHSTSLDAGGFGAAMTPAEGHAGALALFGLRFMAALMSGEGESMGIGETATPAPRAAGADGAAAPSSVARTRENDAGGDVGSYGSCRDQFKGLLTETSLGMILREASPWLWSEVSILLLETFLEESLALSDLNDSLTTAGAAAADSGYVLGGSVKKARAPLSSLGLACTVRSVVLAELHAESSGHTHPRSHKHLAPLLELVLHACREKQHKSAYGADLPPQGLHVAKGEERARGKGINSNSLGVGQADYVVRNAAILPVIFATVAANLRVRADTDTEEALPRFLLSSLATLLASSSNLSRSLPTPALLDRLLSLIPSLKTPEASASSVQLITLIGGRVMTVAHLKRVFRILRHNMSQQGAVTGEMAATQQGDSGRAGPKRLSYQFITALSAIVADTEMSDGRRSTFSDNGNFSSPSEKFESVGYGVLDDCSSGVPEATFLLQGEGTSGILLPSLCQFPAAGRGFTFSTWVCPKLASGAYGYRSRKSSRLNGEGRTFSEKLVRPVLLSLLQHSGEGVTLHLEPKNCHASCNGARQVVLTVWPPSESPRSPCSVRAALLTDGDSSSETEDKDDDEDDEVWHHVAISIHPSTYRSRGDAMLVVNGVSFSLSCAMQDSAAAKGGTSSNSASNSGDTLRHALCCSTTADASWKDGTLAMPSPTLGDVAPQHASAFAVFVNRGQNSSTPGASGASHADTGNDVSGAGSSGSSREKGQRRHEVATSLCGRLGAVYFFDGPLSEAAIRGIYGLGPRYRHSFDLTEFRDLYERGGMTAGGKKSQRFASLASAAPELFDGTLRAALMLALNPCVVTRSCRSKNSGNSGANGGGGYGAGGAPLGSMPSSGDVGSEAQTGDLLIVDITPSHNRVRWQANCVSTIGGTSDSEVEGTNDPLTISRQRKANKLLAMASTTTGESERRAGVEKENWYPHAMCLSNTFCDYNYDIRDALECLGGAMVVLPLLRGLMTRDAPIPESTPSLPDFGNLRDISGDQENKNLAVVTIDMIFRLLRPGASSKRLVDVGLFALLAKTLYHLPQSMKTLELYKVVSGHCQSFMMRNGSLGDKHQSFLCFKHLLADIRLWATFPFSAVSRLFAALLSLAANDPNATSRAIPVPTILNALQRFFGERCEDLSEASPDDLQLVHSLGLQTVFALLSRAVHSHEDGASGGHSNRRDPTGLDNGAEETFGKTCSSASSRYTRDVWALVRYLSSDDVTATASTEAMKILLRLLCRGGPEDELVEDRADDGTPDAVYAGQGGGRPATISHAGADTGIDNSTSATHKSPARPLPDVATGISIRSRILLALARPPRHDVLPVHLLLSLLGKRRGGRHGVYAIACACAVLVGSLREGPLPAPTFFAGSGTLDLEDGSLFGHLGLTLAGLPMLFSCAAAEFVDPAAGDHIDGSEMLHRIRISFTLLQLSIHGVFPPDEVMRDVDFVFDAAQGSAGFGGTKLVDGMGVTSGSSIAPEGVSREEFANRYYDAHFEGRVLCIPGLLEPLFLLLHRGDATDARGVSMASLKLYLQLLVSFCSVSLRGFVNRDSVMSYPGWQAIFLKLLAARRRVTSTLHVMSQDHSNALIERNHHIIIVIVRVLTDLHLHAVRFGAPEASVYSACRPGSEDDRMGRWLAGGDVEVGYTPSISVPLAANAHLLQSRELLVLMNRGNRRVGMVVVKDAISMLKVGLAGPLVLSSCPPGDQVSIADVAGAGQNPRSGDKYIPDLGIYMLQSIADVMKREQEASGCCTAPASPIPPLTQDPRIGGSDASGGSSISANTTAGPTQSNADPSVSVRKRLYELNAWLLAGIVTDYMALPPVTVAGSTLDPCTDYHRNHGSFRHHQSWQLLSAVLCVASPQESISATFTTGRMQDVFDRVMTGLTVGFRLGREVTAKMANSAMVMQASGESDEGEEYYLYDGSDGAGPAVQAERPPSVTVEQSPRGSSAMSSGRSLTSNAATMSPTPLHRPVGGPVTSRYSHSLGGGTSPSGTVTPSRPHSRSVATPAKGRETAMSRTVDNVLWMMLRMLLQVYLDAHHDLPEGSSEDVDEIRVLPSVQALSCLESLLQCLHSVVPDFYYRESMVVVARVSFALHEYASQAAATNQEDENHAASNGDDRRTRAWCRAGLQVLCRLLVRQREDELPQRLLAIQTGEEYISQGNARGGMHGLFMDSWDHDQGDGNSESDDNISEGDGTGQIALSSRSSPPSDSTSTPGMQLVALVEQSLATVSPRPDKGMTLKVEECDVFTESALDSSTVEGSPISGASSQAATATGIISPDHILEAITRALELSIADNQLTWELWQAGLATPLVQANDAATEALLNERLTPTGLHRDAENAKFLVESLQTSSSFEQERVKTSFATSLAAQMALDQKSVRHHEDKWRQKEAIAQSAWTLLSEELSNERGPWGRGANNNVTFTLTNSASTGSQSPQGLEHPLWALDLTETSARTFAKLRKDIHGTRHTKASSCTTPRHSSEGRGSFHYSQASGDSALAASTAEEALLTTASARPSVSTNRSSQGSVMGAEEESGHRTMASVLSNEDFLFDQDMDKDNDAVALAASLAKFAKRATEESGRGVDGEETGKEDEDDEDDDDSITTDDKEDETYDTHNVTLPPSLRDPSARESFTSPLTNDFSANVPPPTPTAATSRAHSLAQPGDHDTISAELSHPEAAVVAPSLPAVVGQEKVVFASFVDVITRSTSYVNLASTGMLLISQRHIWFIATTKRSRKEASRGNEQEQEQELPHCLPMVSRCWPSAAVTDVMHRSFQLRFVALELFFIDRTSLFVALNDEKEATRLQTTIRRVVRPPLIAAFYGRRPQTIMRKFMIPSRLAGAGMAMHSSGLNNSGLVGRRRILMLDSGLGASTSAGAMGTSAKGGAGTVPAMNAASGSGALIRLKDAWINREISNFDYLMKLNSIAGRNYNDLGQYPVFPWVLKDYRSETLDLSDPGVYRDLRYPVGAQNPKRREEQQQRYADLEDNYHTAMQMLEESGEEGGDLPAGVMPPFHWGSHYSVAGFVLWYLMRVEPYTSLHVQLQDGKFDKPDRLFRSIGEAWESCIANPSDVKELVPELFYLPEILINNNHVDLGTTQQGHRVDDVELPPWAKDAHDFIFQHRLALESDYVSANLHHWIDLVFGSKQRPPHVSGGSKGAVDACNVFFHLTYPDAVNLDKLRLSDPMLYEQYQCQIAEFGQSPAQLFLEDHEPRKRFSAADIFWPLASCVLGFDTASDRHRWNNNNNDDYQRYKVHRPHRAYTYRPVSVAASPVIFLMESCSNDKLVTVDSLLVVGQHSWRKESPDLVPPFKLKQDGPALDASRAARATHTLDGRSGMNRGGATTASSDSSQGSPRDRGGILSSGLGVFSSISSGFGNMVRSGSSRDVSSRFKGSMSSSTSSSRRTMLESMGIKGPTSHVLSLGVPLCASFYKDNVGEATTVSDPHGAPQQVPASSSSAFSFFSKKSAAATVGEGVTASSGSSGRTTKQAIEEREKRSKRASFQTLKPSGNTRKNEGAFTSNVATPRAREPGVSSQLFSVIDGGDDGRYLFSCGHWDQSVRVTNLDSGKLLHAARQHRDIVTCLTTVEDRSQWWMVTGSQDCSIQVWELFSHALPGNYVAPMPDPPSGSSGDIDKKASGRVTFDEEDDSVIDSGPVDNGASSASSSSRETCTLPSFPLHILYGHDDCVTCVAANAQLDVIVSGSDDCTVMVHSLRKGEYIRSITQRHPAGTPRSNYTDIAAIAWVGISQAGYIVTYSKSDCSLCSYTLNGTFLARVHTGEPLYALTLSEDGLVLLTGGENCVVVLRWVRSLELANDGPRLGLEAVLDGSLSSPGDAEKGYTSVISSAAASITGGNNPNGGGAGSLVIAPFSSPIRSLYLTTNERHLLVGDDDGKVRVITQDSNYLRERLEKKLIEYGILDM